MLGAFEGARPSRALAFLTLADSVEHGCMGVPLTNTRAYRLQFGDVRDGLDDL